MNSKYRIFVNFTLLSDPPIAIASVANNLFKNLPTEFKNRYNFETFSANPNPLGGYWRKTSKYYSPNYGKLAGIIRFFWTQFVLPLYYYNVSGKKLVFSISHHGSLLIKNQIITIHDLIALQFPYQHPLQWLYFQTVLRILSNLTIAIITVSESTKKDIVKRLNIPSSKIYVINNAVDLNTFNTKIASKSSKYLPSRDKYFLIVGVRFKHKNIERVLKAFSISRTNCNLIIVNASKQYKKKLQIEAGKLDILHKVQFLGYIPDEDLASLYGHAVGLIYPSLYEGFGMPLLESMACGCPVICSKIDSLKEVAGDSAIFFDPFDVYSISQAIDKIENDDLVREKLILQGYNNIIKYSWPGSSSQLAKTIDGILS